MRAHFCGLAAFSAGLWLAPAAHAATLYLAPPPTGSDANAGTSEAAPVASFSKAQQLAQPGDTVLVRGGTYAFSKGTTTCSSGTATISGVVLDKSGTSGKLINYFAYPGEVPVLDFDGIRDSCRIKGILVTGSYIHLRGLTVTRVRQNNDLNHESWGVWNQGSHNVFEALDVHHIMGAGIFIQKGGDNLVLNCDSHHNFDEHTSNGAGESGDGFGCHVDATDSGNVFRGCRAWWNSDDGFDFINADAACTVEYSWAWFNGYKPDSMDAIGNGNGFKGGGYGADPAAFPDKPAEHVVRFCLAFNNRAAGFYANHHPISELFYNNTSYGNHPDFNMLGMNSSGADITVGVYRNNVAVGSQLFSNRSGADETNNSWTIAGITVSDADFQSVSTTGMDGKRAADGSLPVLPNFHLASGSDLIDAGVDLKLPFAGKAPDLGAFEVGSTPPPGLGGGASAAGSTAGGSASIGGAASGGAQSGGRASGGGASGGMGAGGSASVAGSAVVGSEGGESAAGGSSSSAGASPSSGAPASVAGTTAGPDGAGGSATTAGGTQTTDSANDAGGCSCRLRAASPNRSAFALLLAALALVRRRSRSATARS